ncbi:four helix bundle protein [Catalinimonas alkaloidigena]|uniref:four helix bundle protein n=1 Tax=Catalinimonas alkaloidigena TaxID=1075417 RepID=UPI00240615CD|nr:four helix bundle protein [Catalinimonas alkaloidigena]MDF9797416.1 four helix bundle protein [Catalinimonas alkaloidigena]
MLTNIAEGCGRYSDNELQRFIIITMGSASELEYQLLLAKDLGYLPLAAYEILCEELVVAKKMLNIFIKKIKKRSPKKY